jgi:hypothetical protein
MKFLIFFLFLFFLIGSASAISWTRPVYYNITSLNSNHSNYTDFWDNLDTPLDFIDAKFSDNITIGNATTTINGTRITTDEIFCSNLYANNICYSNGTNCVAGNATVNKTIFLVDNSFFTAGSGTITTIFILLTSRLYYTHTGTTGNQSLIFRREEKLPEDFINFTGDGFSIDTFTNQTLNNIQATIYKNGSADATINGLSVKPSILSTWQTKTSSFGSNYSAGDYIIIMINSTTVAPSFNSIDRIYLKYNARTGS